MLQLDIPEREYYDSQKEVFINIKAQTISMEHSLISISKWESKWKKPFLGQQGRTFEETIDYLRCMTLTPNVNPLVYQYFTTDLLKKVNDYIDDSMTATWFNDVDGKKGQGGQQITSELIYYWMVTFRIPFECQKWHLNRLLTLVRICEVKNMPSKKMKKKDIYARNRELNAARKRKTGNKG